MNQITQTMNRAIKYSALFFFLLQFAFAQLSDLDTRCLWIVRESMYNEKMINSALVYAYQSGYNIVFIQVRGRGYAFYNSDIVPKHPKIAPEFDPLDYAVTLGHALGIEVHAWMNSYILWSAKTPPENPEHLYHTQKGWTEANIHGKMDSQIKLSQQQSPQWEGVYLSPTHPEVNPYLLSVYSEIINSYNIDGIHLDYIRFQDEVYGYNKSGMAVFENTYDINPRDIVRGIISPRFGWSQEFVDSMYVAWDKFRRDAVTELVRNIYTEIHKKGNNIKLSAAVKPNLIDAKYRWYQEWDKWVKEGMIDFVVPMNYFKEIRDFNNSVQIMKSNLVQEELEMVVIGISTHNQDAQSAADKILLARLNGFKGVSIFSWDAHKNNLDWFQPINDALGHPTFD
ncbi:hypothetical protein EB821_04285 [Candidatus Marinimicrobia bacterium PRS2]|nr:hypothetical protein EB821_04285 [Candidatus Marinimicrobia bacterium PRS2]